MAEYSSGYALRGSREDPPYKISFSDLVRFLRKLESVHYHGMVNVYFGGKDGVYQMTWQEGVVRQIPVTSLEDVDYMIDMSKTEEEDENER